jgi:cytochrome b6-f complex iron-sulfur subunit
MAEKKKLSVEEILAMARGNKATSASTPTPAAPAQPEPAPREESADAAETPAAAAPVAKVDAKKMSTADILAMAKGGAKPAASAPAAPKAAAKPAAGAPAKGGAMSINDILAAARGGGAPAAEKPAHAKPAPAKAAAPAKAEKFTAVTEKTVIRDNASILGGGAAKKLGPVSKSEAGGGVAVATKPVKEKTPVPPMPARPAMATAAPAATTTNVDRRGVVAAMVAGTAAFFGYILGNPLAIGFTSLATTGLVWTLGGARYMFPNVLVEPPTKFKAGFPDTLSPGQVETKYIPQFGVWVVKNEYEGKSIIYAIKSVCTHLGCTPNWLEGEQKFKCPCHGSGFYKDGINFEGPAPRPLERYAISLSDDGQLLVDKSRTFNQELGQWSDPNSFVPV